MVFFLLPLFLPAFGAGTNLCRSRVAYIPSSSGVVQQRQSAPCGQDMPKNKSLSDWVSDTPRSHYLRVQALDPLLLLAFA